MLAIRERLVEVHDLVAHDVCAAMARMGESIAEFFELEALTEALLDPSLAFMFSLAGLFEDATPSKSARKDQRKADRIRSVTAHVYAGVPHKIARWGHEAHGEGLRAFGIDRSAKTSPDMKMKAHHDAYQAHVVAAHHLGRAGHKQAAELHQRAAAYHRDRRSSLTKQHSLPSMEAADRPYQSHDKRRDPEYHVLHQVTKGGTTNWDARVVKARSQRAARRLGGKQLRKAGYKTRNTPDTVQSRPWVKRYAVSGGKANADFTSHKLAKAFAKKHSGKIEPYHTSESVDLKDVPSRMHVAAWRLGKLRKKLRTKSEAKEPRTKRRPDSSVAFPKEEQIHNWLTDLDEGGYSDDVKRASKLAADATATSQQPHANSDHHDTAARLHFIAHGIAKAHGHEDLAKKHAEFVGKHKKAAAQAKAVA